MNPVKLDSSAQDDDEDLMIYFKPAKITTTAPREPVSSQSQPPIPDQEDPEVEVSDEELESYFKPASITPRNSQVSDQGANTSLPNDSKVDQFLEESGLGGEVLRHVGRSGLRAGEAALGHTFNFIDFLRNIFVEDPEKFEEIRKDVYRGTKFQGKDLDVDNPEEFASWKEKVGAIDERVPLPTSEFLKDLSYKHLGEWAKPQGEFEQIGDDVVSDTVSLMMPLFKGVKGMSPLRSLGVSLVGNTSKTLAKAFDLSPTAQEGVKLATMLLSSIWSGFKPKEKGKELLNKASEMSKDELLPNSKRFGAELQNLLKDFEKGSVSISEREPYNIAKQVLDNVKKQGFADVEEVINMRNAINDARYAAGKEAKQLAPLNKLDAIANKYLDLYSEANPEFGKLYRAGNSLYAADHQRKSIAKFLSKSIDLSKVSGQTLYLLGLQTLDKATLGTIGGLYGAHKVGKLTKNMMKNPEFRKYYFEVLEQSAKGNADAASKNLMKLDKAVRESGDTLPNSAFIDIQWDEEEEDSSKS